MAENNQNTAASVNESLRLYPVQFDGKEIFQPDSWEEISGVVESVNETEAGTDQVIVTRYDKLEVSTSFRCTNRGAKLLKEYSMRDSVAVQMFDFLTEDYVTRSMRIRDWKVSLNTDSVRTPGTKGLWTVSFTLKEF